MLRHFENPARNRRKQFLKSTSAKSRIIRTPKWRSGAAPSALLWDGCRIASYVLFDLIDKKVMDGFHRIGV